MKSHAAATPWLFSQPDARDQIRLFCFPYAGTGASVYRGWAQAFPAAVGVYAIQLPGRENRIAEKPMTDLGALVESLAEALRPHLTRPFLFFGHSLGARIAFELARTIRSHWGLQPCRLLVSGSRAAHLPELRPLHQLPDDDFVAELRRFSGTPEAILQSKELMDLFLPILRADFMVDETYVYTESEPLDCPIFAFCGTEDIEATPKEMNAWARHTSADFSLELIDGGHFFLQTQKERLLRSISNIVTQHLIAASL